MSHPETSNCICLLGWYFHDEALYTRLARHPDATLYILSHQPRERVPGWVEPLVGKGRVFYEPNLGYDWGGYQQFLERGTWRDFSHVFFMHDDLEVKDDGFVEASVKLLKQFAIVGNGAQHEHPFVPRRSPQRYAHAEQIPGPEDAHPGVRGSFMATTPESLTAIGSFDIFWDRFGCSPDFGNHSLVATFHKWQRCLGRDDFCGWLSETYCESQWITELVRGFEEPSGLARLRRYTPSYYYRKMMRGMLMKLCRWKTQACWRRGAQRHGGIVNYFARRA